MSAAPAPASSPLVPGTKMSTTPPTGPGPKWFVIVQEPLPLAVMLTSAVQPVL